MIDQTLQATLASRDDGHVALVAGHFATVIGRESRRYMAEECVGRVNEILATGKGRRALRKRLARMHDKTGSTPWHDRDYLPTKIALEVREHEHAENLAAKRAARARGGV